MEEYTSSTAGATIHCDSSSAQLTVTPPHRASYWRRLKLAFLLISPYTIVTD